MAANWKPKTDQMKHMVTLAERVKTKNAAGYPVAEMRERVMCWAAVDTWQGGLTVQDDADTNTDFVRVRIRYREWVKEGLYVLWHDRPYEITRVDHYDYKNDFLCLECRAREVARA